MNSELGCWEFSAIVLSKLNFIGFEISGGNLSRFIFTFEDGLMHVAVRE